MFKVDPAQETIKDLKLKINIRMAYPCELMTFMLNGRYLGGLYSQASRSDSNSIEGKALIEFGVEADTTLLLICRWSE